MLSCDGPGCHAVLSTEGDVELHVPTKADLLASAGAYGWTSDGKRWHCPDCPYIDPIGWVVASEWRGRTSFESALISSLAEATRELERIRESWDVVSNPRPLRIVAIHEIAEEED